MKLRCAECHRVFDSWPEPFHYWYTRGGTRLICQGHRWRAIPVEPTVANLDRSTPATTEQKAAAGKGGA